GDRPRYRSFYSFVLASSFSIGASASSTSLSRVVGRDGITVNSIPPGRLHSEQIDQKLLPSEEAQRKWVAENCPAGYIGEPEDLAVLVAFLASPRARYISDQVIHVDVGA